MNHEYYEEDDKTVVQPIHSSNLNDQKNRASVVFKKNSFQEMSEQELINYINDAQTTLSTRRITRLEKTVENVQEEVQDLTLQRSADSRKVELLENDYTEFKDEYLENEKYSTINSKDAKVLNAYGKKHIDAIWHLGYFENTPIKTLQSAKIFLWKCFKNNFDLSNTYSDLLKGNLKDGYKFIDDFYPQDHVDKFPKEKPNYFRF